MAERVILVCDVCGAPATETVSFKAGARSMQKDLCQAHLAELTAGARAPKRGRRAGAKAGSSGSSRSKRIRKASTSKASSNGRRRKRKPQARVKA
jgi:hypothetical protein